MMAVDIRVVIIMSWFHRDVRFVNASCDTWKACDVSEFSGDT